MRRIADFASIWNVRTGCHGATDLSPISMSAALHFDVWAPNFGIQEYMRHSEKTWEVFTCDYSFSDGYLHIGDKPGLGVDIDELAAAKYPYEPKQLPVARLEDGSMWNW
jgi:mannonate dehydratase